MNIVGTVFPVQPRSSNIPPPLDSARQDIPGVRGRLLLRTLTTVGGIREGGGGGGQSYCVEGRLPLEGSRIKGGERGHEMMWQCSQPYRTRSE